MPICSCSTGAHVCCIQSIVQVVWVFANAEQDDGGEKADASSKGKKGPASDQPADPSSTLEPNIEALNVKKFDLTFAVDPLFHKTSAQFDEGGAKGRGKCIRTPNISSFRCTS